MAEVTMLSSMMRAHSGLGSRTRMGSGLNRGAEADWSHHWTLVRGWSHHWILVRSWSHHWTLVRVWSHYWTLFRGWSHHWSMVRG